MSKADEGMTLAEAEAVVAKVNEHVKGLGYSVEIRPQVLATDDKRDPSDIVKVVALFTADPLAEVGVESDVWLSMLTPRTLLSVVYNAMDAAHQRVINHHLDKVEAECQA